jgi:hypothetical protein
MTVMGGMLRGRRVDHAMREILHGSRQDTRIGGGRAGQAHGHHCDGSRQPGATS